MALCHHPKHIFVYMRYTTQTVKKARHLVKSASRGSSGPASKTVGNVRGIAVSSNTLAKVTGRSDGARVVDTGSTVVGFDGGDISLVEAVGKANAAGGSSGTLADHALDLGLGARVLDDAAAVAAGSAVVVLHEARVVNGVARGGYADTASRLLHDDGEDEAVVDIGGGSNGFDGRLDVVDFSGGVIGHVKLSAPDQHLRFVGSEHVIKRDPIISEH